MSHFLPSGFLTKTEKQNLLPQNKVVLPLPMFSPPQDRKNILAAKSRTSRPKTINPKAMDKKTVRLTMGIWFWLK